MCGRYLIDDEAYADILQILHDMNAAKDRVYSENITMADFTKGEYVKGEVFPTNIAPVIENGMIVAVQWGFPHWKNTGVIINARSETALEKRMFGKPLRERRCVIPSSGFYEWGDNSNWGHSGDQSSFNTFNYNRGRSSGFNTGRNTGRKRKNKYLFRRPGEHSLYMAGMVGTFRDALGNEYSAFTILTTVANDDVAPIHDRMPVILAADEVDLWINDNVFMEFVLHRPGPELAHVLEGTKDSADFEQLTF